MAYCPLLDLHPHLSSIAFGDHDGADADKIMTTGDAWAKQKAEEMVKFMINQPDLWHNLTLYILIYALC